MGIDCVLFDRLVELSTRFQPKGRSLMLGRQGFGIQTQYRKAYEEALQTHGIEGKRFDFLQEDGYAETLMSKLGFGAMETMDFSDYEGATLIHDLNQLPPKKLEKKFTLLQCEAEIKLLEQKKQELTDSILDLERTCQAIMSLRRTSASEQPALQMEPTQ